MTNIPADNRTTRHCLLICGGREFDDRAELVKTLDRLHEQRPFTQVIAGGAQGAGRLAKEWAIARGVACEIYHTDWVRLGREAGRIRNERMLADGKPDFVVAFPGGRRTAHLMRIARNAGVEVMETAPRRGSARPGLRSSVMTWWAQGVRWALSGLPPRANAMAGRLVHASGR
jgi:hypothetical protein